MRALAATMCLVAACSIPGVNLDGKACPCVAGYVCSNNVCVRTIGDGGADGSSDALGSTLFDDEFNGTTIDPVWNLDTGTWTEGGGVITETIGPGGTTIWVNGFATATDYEVIASMRVATGTPINDDAMELAVRVSNTATHYRYQCSWEPGDKFLRLFDVPRTRTNDLDSAQSTQTFDPLQAFTMHVRVTGATVHCWVEGITSADLTLTLSPTQLANGLAAGSFGIATYNLSDAFDYIRVVR